MSKTTNKFSPEVRERTDRMVSEHRANHRSEWDAMVSIAGKIGCTAETLRRWCRDEAGRRAGPAAMADDDRPRLFQASRLEAGRGNRSPWQYEPPR